MTSTVVDLSERRSFRNLWLAAAAWTVWILIEALTLRVHIGLPFSIGLEACLDYYVLGAFVWGICAATSRWRLWDAPPGRAIAIQVMFGAVALTTWGLVDVGLSRVRVGPDYWQRVYANEWAFMLTTSVLVYAASVGLGLTVQAFERQQRQRQREAELEVAAREAELEAVKSQLRPHFLLNAANTILSLIDHDPAEARQMVTRLASLLHSVFERLDEPAVPFERELETIRVYLEIERLRFGDRLRFTIEADPGAGHVLVPPFVLQPLVENAVKHGVEPYPDARDVRITARLANPHLHVAVEDFGEGCAQRGTRGTGRGLELTRRRLDAAYGERAVSVRAERHARGFNVNISFPATWNGDGEAAVPDRG